ncbi:oligopeptide:H+ symporter, partial [Janthinobacterium sp.]|uniref:peptide MFS transporter n=1 Tax=Janthinobacterium sp. TaxID=1871054 RepID=UPI00293D493B
MSGATNTLSREATLPEFKQIMGHPSPLWMLFMTEFWERFAFYGIRWALVLYIVAQFHGGDASGQAVANLTYGSYLALVYAGALFGGYIADRIIGYQRSILIGACFMAVGLFAISIPNPEVFKLGLATIIVGNGMFKPNISTMVGKLYSTGDTRRDSGFTVFYMGINMGAFFAPLFTQRLAQVYFGTSSMPAYKMVFIAAGIGMLISLVWFWFGRKQLKGLGLNASHQDSLRNVSLVLVGGLLIGVPVFYTLLTIDASLLQYILMALFVVPAVMLFREGVKEGSVPRDKVVAMLT